jgi:tRNA pseudouridine55 synthase
MTSHDVVNKLRAVTGVQKIGHAGTLDPFARGLLILGIGRGATKRLSVFQKKDKEYTATLKLGEESNTFDKDGKIVKKVGGRAPDKKDIDRVLKEFLGEGEQIPPIFSAKKVRGQRLYQLARKGMQVSPRPIRIVIDEISVLKYRFPYLKIKVKCSSGTYIRSLANDIGKKLGCGALAEDLVRTKIGELSVAEAAELDDLNSQNWRKFLRKID